MATNRPFSQKTADDDQLSPDGAPPGDTKDDSIQRLQVGIIGLFSVVLVVGVASAFQSGADKVEENTAPGAVSTTEPTGKPTSSDPMAAAGAGPDLSAEAEGDGEANKDDAKSKEPVVPDIDKTLDSGPDSSRKP